MHKIVTFEEKTHGFPGSIYTTDNDEFAFLVKVIYK